MAFSSDQSTKVARSQPSPLEHLMHMWLSNLKELL